MLRQALSLIPLVLSHVISASQIPITNNAKLDPELATALLSLHHALVKIESVSGNEKKIGNWLTRYLRAADWKVERQKVSEDRYNIFAYGSRRETKVLLTTHIDTVPPHIPYGYNETTDIISGRGSVDAKASVAAQIIAATVMQKETKDDISLLFVVGEETGGDGMRAFNSWSERPASHELVIFGEPTEGKLVCGHKGMLSLVLNAKGKAAHSGYPWLGVSANDILVEALGELLKLRQHLPWSEKYGNTTVNFGKIEGGVAANVVAETASAEIATRIAAKTPDHVYGLIKEALKGVERRTKEAGGDLWLERVNKGYAPVDIDCNVKGFEKLTVNYGTDVPFFDMKKGCEGRKCEGRKRFLYGAGSIFVAHGDHEALKRRELEQSVLDYQRIIRTGLGKRQIEL